MKTTKTIPLADDTLDPMPYVRSWAANVTDGRWFQLPSGEAWSGKVEPGDVVLVVAGRIRAEVQCDAHAYGFGRYRTGGRHFDTRGEAIAYVERSMQARLNAEG